MSLIVKTIKKWIESWVAKAVAMYVVMKMIHLLKKPCSLIITINWRGIDFNFSGNSWWGQGI